MNKSFIKLKFVSLIALVLLSLSCSLTVQETTGDLTLPLPSSRAATTSSFTITLENSKGESKSYETNKTYFTISKLKVGKYTLHIKGTVGYYKYHTAENGFEVNIKGGKKNNISIPLEMEEIIPTSIKIIKAPEHVIFAEHVNINDFTVMATYPDGKESIITDFSRYVITPDIITDDCLHNSQEIACTITHVKESNVTASVSVPCRYNYKTSKLVIENSGSNLLTQNEKGATLTATFTPSLPAGSYSTEYKWYNDKSNMPIYTSTQLDTFTLTDTFEVPTKDIGNGIYHCEITLTLLDPTHVLDNTGGKKEVTISSDNTFIRVQPNTSNLIFKSTADLEKLIQGTPDYAVLSLNDNYIVDKEITFAKPIKIAANNEIVIKRDPSYTGNMFKIEKAIEFGSNKNLNRQSQPITFDGNNVKDSGNIFYVLSGDGSLTLGDCTFQNNLEKGNGGGAIYSAGRTHIEDCIFINNSTKKSGGALFIGNGENYFTNVIMVCNTAMTKGGAISMHGTPTKIIINNNSNSLISYNQVLNDNGIGGGIYQEAGDLQLKEKTVINNNSVKKQKGNGMNLYITTTHGANTTLNGVGTTRNESFDSVVDSTTKPQNN